MTVHRAGIGSVERAVAHLIEVHGGAFPAWLAPVQIAVLSVSEAEAPQAAALVRHCLDAGLRAEAAGPATAPGARVRAARLIPYQAVIGPREVARDGVALLTSSLQRQNDPDALVNFRTPCFDLDSVYGRGPVDQPYLYQRTPDAGPPRFVVGTPKGEGRGELDLPRDPRGVALIGDPRNDESVILSQLQLTFILFHNRVCDWLTAGDGSEYVRHRRAGEEVFDCARRLVRWHDQWVVVHDFLKRIVDAVTYKDVLHQEPLVPQGDPVEQVRLRFFAWRHQIFMPVEFAVAAYRFGHSLVRPAYRLNATVGPLPVPSPGPPSGTQHEPRHLGGFRRLPAGWQIDWGRFFHLAESDGLQYARRIDRYLAAPLRALPPALAGGEITDLARRNLTRGARLGLPCGQHVALAMGIEPLDDEDLDLPDGGPAPLWYYVLREAELHDAGRTPGRAGCHPGLSPRSSPACSRPIRRRTSATPRDGSRPCRAPERATSPWRT